MSPSPLWWLKVSEAERERRAALFGRSYEPIDGSGRRLERGMTAWRFVWFGAPGKVGHRRAKEVHEEVTVYGFTAPGEIKSGELAGVKVGGGLVKITYRGEGGVMRDTLADPSMLFATEAESREAYRKRQQAGRRRQNDG